MIMEKRALLAAVLSLSVLYIWSALFSPQKPNITTENIPQVIDIKEDKKIYTETPVDVETPSAHDATPSEFIEKIDSETLTLGFSSLGGSLRSAEINKYKTTLPTEYLGNTSTASTLSYTQHMKAGRSIT